MQCAQLRAAAVHTPQEKVATSPMLLAEQPLNHDDVSSKSQSQLSAIARTAIMTSAVTSAAVASSSTENKFLLPPLGVAQQNSIMISAALNRSTLSIPGMNVLGPSFDMTTSTSAPSTAPASPRIPPLRSNSGTTTPRTRPPATTLNIPGLTRSKVSPDGRIADRDVGAKVVVIMVGLPARGKSYITKKVKRYLAWQQHDVRIFNVGERRRFAVGKAPAKEISHSARSHSHEHGSTNYSLEDISEENAKNAEATEAAHMLLTGTTSIKVQTPTASSSGDALDESHAEQMEQSAEFFDPSNVQASVVRQQVALATLEELLDYLLLDGGAVGILDATNSTIKRRQQIFDRIKERDPRLGILFIESVCEDKDLLEANMRLKLSGPDYKDKDPIASLEDFRKRVAAYESAYEPIGRYEEQNHMQYIKMIDVGRKVIHHQLKGFLSTSIATYLTTFNLAPRQIWITRHGKSIDNELGKIGGNSELTNEGHTYSEVLYKFITQKRKEWKVDQKQRMLQATFPPIPGESTPPYPDLGELDEKNFCVWTSMLERSVQTAQYFEADEDYDVKAWEMLNELNAGQLEGLTYSEISSRFPQEYSRRKRDKLHYIYPGVGGEGYLQVISRLREMIREIERITDHVLVIGHRSVARVLMAYFMDLTRDDIADLDVPLGMLYVLEPRPYGVDFHAYRYNEQSAWFDELVNYKPQKEVAQGN